MRWKYLDSDHVKAPGFLLLADGKAEWKQLQALGRSLELEEDAGEVKFSMGQYEDDSCLAYLEVRRER